MGKIEEARRTIDQNIRTNGTQEITGGVLNVVLNDMMDATEEVSVALPNKVDKEQGKGLSTNDFTDAYKTAIDTMPETLGNLSTEVAQKAEQDGKYPQLTSGFANNLVGRGESTESEFTFRASGGKSIEDGAARISELRGNGVVWNQLVRLKNNVSGVGGITVVVNADGSFSVTGTNTSGSDVKIAITENFANISGHKYCVTGYPSGGSLETYYLLEGYSTKKFYNGYVGTLSTTSNEMSRFVIVIKAGYSISGTLVFKPKITDLTLMFGAGNEPTTIEEFNARKPIGVDEYAYNEGTLIPFNADGIKSVGFNAWDGAMEEGYVSDTDGTIDKVQNSLCTDFVRILPNNDYFIRTDATSGRWGAWYDSNKQYISGIAGGGIKTSPANAVYMRMTIVENGNGNPDTFCINLSHTGYRNGEYQPYEDFVREIDPRIKEAFPNGMKPWDKVYNKNGKGYIVKGTGVVDLGTLNWFFSQEGFFIARNLPIYAASHWGTVYLPNVLSERYVPTRWGDIMVDIVDKGCSAYENQVRISDSSYTDKAAFKAAMAGVPLWYELAEPEVIEYDEPFNLDYTVWDFGTEEILSEQPSAPISADIIYQFNAVDTIRNNQIEIEQLKTMIATMQAQMASMVSNEDVIE